METTYGDRAHKPLEPSIEELYQAINDTFRRGGNVVIPTFALERAQEMYGAHPAGDFWVPHRLGGGAPSLAEAARLEAEEAATRAARRTRSAGAPEE